IRMPDAAEGMGTGSLEPQSSLPWQTPWRVIMAASNLSAIVESTLVTDLARPSIAEQTDWIRPGRVSWSWWSDQDSPQDCSKLKKFIDLAAEMKWEYSLIDANWTIMKNGTIHDLAKYAKWRGVDLLLWYNSGGLHNEVSEKPRGLMFHPSIRRKEFQLLKNWGVKGVKVDFFQSDKQNVISLYHAICKEAAEAQIMVNFHGCTLPRGWDRTYPHLMSMESVRGEECYIFDRNYPEIAPWYNTVLAFTRNVVGPMDFTPVAFSDNRYKHLTTNAHELALSVVFESGWLHFADSVESYRRQPGAVKDFLKVVPTTWDDTKFITGFPGKNVVLARSKEEEWYVGGINGEPTETIVQVPLSFLAGGKYKMVLIQDGNDPRSFSTMKKDVLADDTIEVKMLPNGGFAMRFYKGWF
ncbi:MAG: glycoside hydrolase family 97 catalytic domain-containing protein, partial [Sedimentisphaerales bacterium]|nr:glycoside hydrolase family 97 catalytic domain-containing protein [Sedimentisphaerales bacterium]